MVITELIASVIAFVALEKLSYLLMESSILVHNLMFMQTSDARFNSIVLYKLHI